MDCCLIFPYLLYLIHEVRDIEISGSLTKEIVNNYNSNIRSNLNINTTSNTGHHHLFVAGHNIGLI
jgi:hypothetical protein